MNNNNLKQYELNNTNVTTQWVNIPSLSTPSFGGICNFDINCIGKIEEVYAMPYIFHSLTIDTIIH